MKLISLAFNVKEREEKIQSDFNIIMLTSKQPIHMESVLADKANAQKDKLITLISKAFAYNASHSDRAKV